MIRIMIDWTFVSPVLQIASGILKVEFINNEYKDKLLFKCKVRKERGTTGYSSVDKTDQSLSIPSSLFEKLKPTIDTMVHSYFNGMMLKEMDFHWIEDEHYESIENWAKKKGINLPEGI